MEKLYDILKVIKLHKMKNSNKKNPNKKPSKQIKNPTQDKKPQPTSNNNKTNPQTPKPKQINKQKTTQTQE